MAEWLERPVAEWPELAMGEWPELAMGEWLERPVAEWPEVAMGEWPERAQGCRAVRVWVGWTWCSSVVLVESWFLELKQRRTLACT